MSAPPTPNRWQVRRHSSGRWIASITYDPPQPVAPGVATRDRAQWTDTHAEAIAYADRKAREGDPTMTNDARLTDLTYPAEAEPAKDEVEAAVGVFDEMTNICSDERRDVARAVLQAAAKVRR